MNLGLNVISSQWATIVNRGRWKNDISSPSSIRLNTTNNVTAMDEKAYIEQRLDDQIGWYDRKSQWNQRWFKRLRLIEIVCACSIPFLVSTISPEDDSMRLVTGVIGVVVAVVAGLVSLYKFEENWIAYRTTCESLRHEKFLYLTRATPYDGAASFPLFVQRVEGLISKENSDWSQLIKSQEER